MAQVRYLVKNVDEAVMFHTEKFGFHIDRQFGPAMAIHLREDLKVWVAGSAASASESTPTGGSPSAADGIVSCSR
jgi:hypothetical protein